MKFTILHFYKFLQEFTAYMKLCAGLVGKFLFCFLFSSFSFKILYIPPLTGWKQEQNNRYISYVYKLSINKLKLIYNVLSSQKYNYYFLILFINEFENLL